MNCKNVLNLLSLYQDGECNTKTETEIKKHLEKCLSCKQEWILINRMVNEIKKLRVIEPEKDFNLSIMAKIDVQKKIISLPIPSMVYSFVFIFFFFLGFFLSQKIGSPRSPETSTQTMVQLLMESQRLNQLDIQEKTVQLLYEKENNENQQVD